MVARMAVSTWPRAEAALRGMMGLVNGRAPGRGHWAVPGVRNPPEAMAPRILPGSDQLPGQFSWSMWR